MARLNRGLRAVYRTEALDTRSPAGREYSGERTMLSVMGPFGGFCKASVFVQLRFLCG